MKKIGLNFIKRKIYKALPGKIRLRLLRFFLPELKLELDHIVFRTALPMRLDLQVRTSF